MVWGAAPQLQGQDGLGAGCSLAWSASLPPACGNPVDATWAHPSSLMLQIKTQTGASLQPHFPTVRKENVVVQVSLSLVSNSLRPHGRQHARLPSPSLSPRVCSNSCPLSQQCHPTISSCVAPSCPHQHLFQHQGLFQCVGSSHQVAKVSKLQLQQQFFQ